jgi:hypothetical protein
LRLFLACLQLIFGSQAVITRATQILKKLSSLLTDLDAFISQSIILLKIKDQSGKI